MLPLPFRLDGLSGPSPAWRELDVGGQVGLKGRSKGRSQAVMDGIAIKKKGE